MDILGDGYVRSCGVTLSNLVQRVKLAGIGDGAARNWVATTAVTVMADHTGYDRRSG